MTDYEEVVRLRGRLAELMAERDHLLGSGRIAIDAGEKMIATLSLEKATLTARCEALERETAAGTTFYKLTLQQRDQAWAEVEALKERCEALEQEIAQIRQADQDRFDRDRANFAAGYSLALDDAVTKETP